MKDAKTHCDLLEHQGVKPFEIDVQRHGPFATHNMPCCVCWTNKSVLFTNENLFEPCWECQRNGWVLLRRPQSWYGVFLCRVLGIKNRSAR